MKIESLQAVTKAVAQEREVEKILQTVVNGLFNCEDVALARIWLIDRGDICERCPLRDECPDQTRCLHLAASQGCSIEGDRVWDSVDGMFSRFPLNTRMIGRIGSTGKPLFIPNIKTDPRWSARTDCVEREWIVSFAGQPLVFRDEVLGVLAVFS